MTPRRRTSRCASRVLASSAAVLLLAAVVVVSSGQPASAATAVAVTFEVAGAQGGGGGGGGGVMTATATFDAGTQIEVHVGGSDGFNGGGAGGLWIAGASGIGQPGSGGGTSDLRIGGSTLADRALVAGGGGGHGGAWLPGGGTGGGGGTVAQGGAIGAGSGQGSGGGGATGSAPGAGGARGTVASPTSGAAGGGAIGGTGGNSSPEPFPGGAGGGGGGGWFGGGGGGGACCLGGGGGAGGGSSFASGLFPSPIDSTGTHGGNGQVRMSLDGGATWVTTFSYTGGTQTYTVPEPPHPISLDVVKGPNTGGTAVTITGTDLTDTSQVLFCGTPATDLVVQSDTQVDVTAPAGAVGTCDVRVNTNASGTGAIGSAYRYFGVPSVGSVEAAGGPVSGGNPVTIDGSSFTGATAVTFGGATAAFTVVGDTAITATVPAHASGAVDVVITTPDASGTGTAAYTYYDAPVITDLVPEAGPLGGGTGVTLTGTGFTGTTGVTFGGVAASALTVVGDGTITADAPPHAEGAVNVTVTNPGGVDTLTNGFTYYDAPSVSDVSPADGPVVGGTTVTLTGTDLAATSGVTFGGIAGTGLSVTDDSTVEVDTPAHVAGAVDVVLTQPGGTSTVAQGFTYVDAPTTTSAAPDTGPEAGGTLVTIAGTHLTATTSVSFGNEESTDVEVLDDQTVTAVAPAGAPGAVDVEIASPGGTSTLVDGFTYYSVPTVTDVSPDDGPLAGGTTVTITGTNLTATTGVTFDGVDGTDLDVIDDATIEVDTPAHAAGAVDIVVEQPDESATVAGGFTYVDIPTTSSAAPDAGPSAGGTTVTITGTHLSATTGVTFGGADSTDVDVLDDETITVVTPAGALGATDIVLTSAGGSATLTAAFTYTEQSTLHLGATDVTWGSRLDVSGHGFAPGSDVVVTLHSDPVVLGEPRAGADGRFELAVTIPEVDEGTHQITAEGIDAYGNAVSMLVPLDVSDGTVADETAAAAPLDPLAAGAAAADDGTMPQTGSDPWGTLLAGVGLVLVGGGLLLTRRHRLS